MDRPSMWDFVKKYTGAWTDTNQRRGQAIVNQLWFDYPDLREWLGKLDRNIDPFDCDDNIPAFWQELQKVW